MDTIELRSGGTVEETARAFCPVLWTTRVPKSIPWGISEGCSWPKVARASSRWPWSSAGRRRTSRRSSRASPWLGNGLSRFPLGRLRPCNREIQAVFNEEFVPTASRWPIGTVGVIDGSGFVKHGPESVGVQRQWCGRLGKKENCQVGVFLLGVTPAGHRPAGPPTLSAGNVGCGRRAAEEDACPGGGDVPDEAADRRRLAGPECRRVSTGSRPTRSSDATAVSSTPGEPRPAVPGGGSRQHDRLGGASRCGRRRTSSFGKCDLLAMGLPAKAWHVIKLREGAKGPLAFEFARLRVWSVRHRHAGPPLWLLIRRSLERVPEVKYYLSNAEPEMPLETMALVTGVPLACGGVFRGWQRAVGDGAVRGPFVDELAPSHELGGVGASVRHANTA